MKSISRRNFCVSMGALCATALASSALPLRKSLESSGTGYAFDFDFDFVSFSNNSAETFQRAEWINSRLVISGVRSDLKPVTPYSDPMEYISKIHTQSHIDMIDSHATAEGFTLTMGQVARTAVGHVLGAVNVVCEGSVRNAFCCIRPPGHHVQNNNESGFCCYANVVIAARFAREKFNIKKILIVDWDYHQGNGTHGHICGDNDILFFETYNPPMYTTLCDDFISTGPDYNFPEDTRRINIQWKSNS